MRACVRAYVHVHLIGRICWPLLPPLLYHSSLFSDTLACYLFASSPYYSPLLSLPPSLSRWPLPARCPQGKLPELRNTVLLHCNALLCPAFLHPYSTHIWIQAHTHTYSVYVLTYKHAHNTPPNIHSHRRCITPSPSLALSLYLPLHRLLLVIVPLNISCSRQRHNSKWRIRSIFDHSLHCIYMPRK